MIRFMMPSYIPQHELERFACALAQADGLNPHVYVNVPQPVPHMFGQTMGTQLWHTYLPKALEFLQMKLIYDRVFPGSMNAPSSVGTHVAPTASLLPDMNDEQAATFKEIALDEAANLEVKISTATLRQLAKNHTVRKYPLRACSICDETLFYAIEGEHVSFQPNCGCSRDWRPPEQRSFDELANSFNIQTKSENRVRMLREFIASGEKQTEL